MAMQEKERIVKHLTVEREQLQRTQEKLQFRIQQLQEELTAASSGQKVAETKMAQELNRLRNHLVQVWQTSPSPSPSVKYDMVHRGNECPHSKRVSR